MAERVALTAVYEDVEGGWVQATIEELPAVITVAPTASGAKELLLDALREYLLSLVSHPSEPPDLALHRRKVRREALTIELLA